MGGTVPTDYIYIYMNGATNGRIGSRVHLEESGTVQERYSLMNWGFENSWLKLDNL